MIQYIFTKETKWLEAWDDFILNHPKGSHLIGSDWLKSYRSYGFDFEIGIVLSDNKIVGGFGAIIPKFSFFKFYIIPHGPIYNRDYDSCLTEHLQKIITRAKKIGSCYFQLSMPISTNNKIANNAYPTEIHNLLNNSLQQGKLFQYIYSSYGLNWIDLSEFRSTEQFLEQLSPKVRRNIRMPYNKNAKAYFVSDMTCIEKGYKIIEENATMGNYSVRSFNEFKHTIGSLVKKKHGHFLICEVEKVPKAAAFFVESNGFFTNIMGGVLREKPDIKLGYMLQWEIIKKAFESNHKAYNISMGGSSGVQDFKSKFNTEAIFYNKPHYHLVIRPLYFNMFRFFSNFLKPYKKNIARLLSKL